jgi:hypothetical protein
MNYPDPRVEVSKDDHTTPTLYEKGAVIGYVY